MTDHLQAGSALIVGLALLALVSILGLAGSAAAHVQWQLARQEHFRENASSAASAGLESAINSIVSSSSPASVPVALGASLAPLAARYETQFRFLGYEEALPQARGGNLVGAHFEIVSTGHASRGAFDRQRVRVMRVVEAPVPVSTRVCDGNPVLACHTAGELRRLAWQRLSR